MNKKEASVIWIGFVHALYSFIASILLTAIVIGVVVFAASWWGILSEADFESAPIMVIAGVIGLLLVWWSVVNSARMVVRRYVVLDARKLVTWSLAFYFLLLAAMSVVDFVLYAQFSWESLVAVLDLIVFYLVSKKYFV